MNPPVSTSRRSAALRMAVRSYARQLLLDRKVAIPALLLPGIGNVFVFYVPPLVISQIMTVFDRQDRPSIGEVAPYVALFGLAWLCGEGLWRLGVHFLNRTDIRGIERLYVEGMDALFEKDLAFFHDNFAGSLTKRVVGYATSYEPVIDTMAFSVVANLVPLAFVVVVLGRMSPLLVLVLIGMLALTCAVLVPLIRRRQALVDHREEVSNEVAGRVADTLANMDAVRAFGQEPAEADAHRANVRAYAGHALSSWDYQNLRIDFVASPLYVATNMLGLLIATTAGRGAVFSIQDVFVIFSYYANFTRVIWQFNQVYRNLETNLAAAAQFSELLLDPPTVRDPAHPVPLVPKDASVKFESVQFRYEKNGSAPLFEAFDLDIASGEKVGLVGRSGGGKTTLTRILLRLMDIDAGTVTIGGQDIAKLSQLDLRTQIAFVPQDPIMFHRSLRANIAFGRLDAAESEIKAAAVAAHAAEFIEELPQGYDTLVGERGIKLSGGQRQRVAIARALLRRAPILVLDEATSSLDSESERFIQHALLTLMEGRTAIVIAHRLSTVRQMDRLIVVDQGRIVEQGSHDELLAHEGTYATLWAHQSGGFLDDGADTDRE